ERRSISPASTAVAALNISKDKENRLVYERGVGASSSMKLPLSRSAESTLVLSPKSRIESEGIGNNSLYCNIVQWKDKSDGDTKMFSKYRTKDTVPRLNCSAEEFSVVGVSREGADRALDVNDSKVLRGTVSLKV